MNFIAKATVPFKVREIADNLTDNGKINLIRRLIRGGLLQISKTSDR